MWAIVTGGSSGLGLALAKRLARQGYDLVLVSRSKERLDEAAAQIARNAVGRDIRVFPLDLSVPGAAERLHEWTDAQGISPDILVNNAGMYFYECVTDVDKSRQEALLGLNVSALASMCRLYGRDMASYAGGGRPSGKYILNIASYSVYMPIEGFAYYAGSKAFVRTFNRCFAKEMRRSGVKVAAVAPAGMDTDLMNLRPGIRKLARAFGFLASTDTIARISLRVMRSRYLHYWIPLCHNVLFIPFLRLFDPLFRKVLKSPSKNLF